MKVLTVKYNHDSDVTKIKFSDDIQYQDWLLKADILQELIAQLTIEYDMLMSIKDFNFRSEWELGSSEYLYEAFSEKVRTAKDDFLTGKSRG